MSTTTADPKTATIDWRDPARAVVVGVDGSERNRAAVAWAVHEAVGTGRPLTLVAVLDDRTLPVPRPSTGVDEERDWQVLDRIAADVTANHPDLKVRAEVDCGGAVSCLLDRSVEQGLLVVGKRGLGTFGRLTVGSTSIAVAGRSRVPVVIVPDEWRQADHAWAAVLVGVQPGVDEETTLRYGFTQAQRKGVGVHVTCALDPQPRLVWDPSLGGAAYHHLQEDGVQVLEAAVKPFRAEFPGVPVHLEVVRGNPSSTVLDEAERAQLIVLGRHRDSRMSGFPLGSVTRGVLHYAEVPVAVVPSD